MPTHTKNLDGTVTLGGDGIFGFGKNASGSEGVISLSILSDTTITLTDGVVNFIYADYNSGNPKYAVTLDNSIFRSDFTKIPVIRATRESTTVHFEEYDLYGLLLANKMMLKDVLINGGRRLTGLTLSTAPTRISTVSAGSAVFAVQYYESMAANVSGSAGTMYEYYLSSGVWNKVLVTSYDATYYSDGTNRLSLDNNKWVAKYFFRDVGDDNEVYYVHGNQYVKQDEAENELLPLTPEVMTSHSVYVGRIVIEKGATDGIAHPRIWTGAEQTGGSSDKHYDLDGSSLVWSASGHTGTADMLASFDASGVAEYTAKSTFEPALTKGNLTAGSSKITIVGTGTNALIGSGASIDINEANIVHQNISGHGTNTHTQIDTHIANDGDLSSTNEIQDLSLSGNTLSLSGDASTVDLSGYAPAFSGTPNYIPKFGTGTTIGNSPIYADASNNIGIGTTSPINYVGTAKNVQIIGNAYSVLTLGNTANAVDNKLWRIISRPDYDRNIFEIQITDDNGGSEQTALEIKRSGTSIVSSKIVNGNFIVGNLAGTGTRLVGSQSDGTLANIANASGYLYNDGTGEMIFNNLTDTFAPASGSANYVQVSPVSAQTGNIWMNGNISVIEAIINAPNKNPGAIVKLKLPSNANPVSVDDKFGIALSADGSYSDRTVGLFAVPESEDNFWNTTDMAFWASGEGLPYREFARFSARYGALLLNQKVVSDDSKIQVNGGVAATRYKLSGVDLFGSLTGSYLPIWSGTGFLNSQFSHSSGGDYMILDNSYAGLLFKKGGVNKFIFGDDAFLTATRPNAYGFYLYGDNVIDFWANSTRIASFGQSSGIQFPSLAGTGTRIVASQSDGKLVNISNASGYLYNDGTNMVWIKTVPQSLSGTTPSLNASNGVNANLSISGATTLTLSNLIAGTSGAIYLTNNASVYRIKIAGYTIAPASNITYDSTGILLPASSVYTHTSIGWYYNGTTVQIHKADYNLITY